MSDILTQRAAPTLLKSATSHMRRQQCFQQQPLRNNSHCALVTFTAASLGHAHARLAAHPASGAAFLSTVPPWAYLQDGRDHGAASRLPPWPLAPSRWPVVNSRVHRLGSRPAASPAPKQQPPPHLEGGEGGGGGG